ncbi:MAG: hypothetical protein HYY06_28065 [Deltaproteobacteria bacterium]|nr:hypothetical protein [Deltaproteobacteria bacterium]
MVKAAVLALGCLVGCASASDAEPPPARRPARSTAATPSKAQGARQTEPATDTSRPAQPPPATVPRTIGLSEPRRPGGDPFAASRQCRDSRSVAVFVSPRRPTVTGQMRIVVVADEEIDGATVVAKGPGGIVELRQEHWGGPPWAWAATVTSPTEGEWSVGLSRDAELVACRRARVRKRTGWLGTGTTIWEAERGWDRGTENLYSAWIEHLFDAPPRVRVGWRPLHEVTRDRERNLLYDHLGLGEDDAASAGALVLEADCADVPYFLRAYFAWKLRLPFQWSHCEAESAWRAPVCDQRFDNGLERTSRQELGAFQELLGRLAETVHSGNMRALPTDDAADFYPVALNRQSIRPGTVFADPYGHVLVVARWIPQTPAESGLLYAIDGNPDRSMGRKRFWRGAFPFGAPVWSGAAGFKAFRPIVKRDGELVALTNREVNVSRTYGNYSHEQYRLGADGFYARVEELINPERLTAERAFDETFDALVELVQARVRSVELGARWIAEHPGTVIEMPEGPEIFESTGPWEDYSTPARDLAMLGAFDLIEEFATGVAERPGHYALVAGEAPRAAAARIAERLARRAAETLIAYRRSDGSEQSLTIREVMDRAAAFEAAYDPNDCNELRWGAPPGSPEASTCNRHAPAAQTERMQTYRGWFERRSRPRRI